MKHFRTLAQTKKDLETLQNRIVQIEQYISLIENYTPQTFTQHVIHQYIREGSMVRTAENLNRLGITIDGRSIKQKDVASTIQSRPAPDDLLHKEVRRLYLKKIRTNRLK